MGRPKKGVKKVNGTAERTKPVRLDFTESMHYKLRVVAAKAGMSMAVYCRLLVEKAVLEAWEKEERGR